MALARSASGPGGLNLNTNTSAPTSLFGSTPAAAPPAGNLFGNASTPASTSLFGNTATTAPAAGGLFSNAAKPATGGLFGGTPATSAAPASGGLFGNATPASSAPATGGLFGGATATSTAPASSGLFGGTNASTTAATAATAAPATGGLFGGTGAFGNSTAQKPATTGGLFGGSTTGGGLFGNISAPQQTGGLFGGANMSQSTTTGGLGATNNSSAGSLFAPAQSQQQQQSQQFGGTLGGGLQLGQTSQQQNVVPGVKIDMSNIRPTTRFNDLNEQLQKDIEAIDNVIFACQQQSHGISSLLPGAGEKIAFLPDSVEFLSRKRIGVESALESDAESLDLVGKLIEQDLHNATLSFRAVDVLNLPQQYHTPRHFLGNTNSNEAETGDIVSFFSQAADEMSGRLSTYQQRIAEIEMHLRGVEAATIEQARALNSGSGANVGDDVREVALVLREFESGILAVAGSVGAAREGVQKLQLGGFEQLGRSSQKVNGNGKRSGIY